MEDGAESVREENRSIGPLTLVGMFKYREGRLRLLSYIGLGLLAIVAIVVVGYCMTTPAWNAPFGFTLPSKK